MSWKYLDVNTDLQLPIGEWEDDHIILRHNFCGYSVEPVDCHPH